MPSVIPKYISDSLQGYAQPINNIGVAGPGTQDIDVSVAAVVLATIDTSPITFTFSNPSPNGTASSFILYLTNEGIDLVTWPDSVTWVKPIVELIFSRPDTLVLQFTTLDSGLNWQGVFEHRIYPDSSLALYSWGQNDNGQLGLGDSGVTTHRSSPVQVGTDKNWLSVAGGLGHSIAIKSVNTLYSWGTNTYGQLGQKDTDHRSFPVQVGVLNDWYLAQCGNAHTMVIKADGSLWAWGENSDGQLGLGYETLLSAESQNVSPVQVGVLNDWALASAGRDHTISIKTNGTLWTWGRNNFGQLGHGDSTNRSTPVQVGTDTDWLSISCGFAHSTAIKTNGTLWTFGYNVDGELGLGDTIGRSEPTQVGSDEDWILVSAARLFNIAIKGDGLWTWGDNGSGQLGLGNEITQLSPAQVSTDIDWTFCDGGVNHSVAIKSGGLWAWGDNNYGQLGHGDSTNRSIPVQVGSDTNWVSVNTGCNHNLSLRLSPAQVGD